MTSVTTVTLVFLDTICNYIQMLSVDVKHPMEINEASTKVIKK